MKTELVTNLKRKATRILSDMRDSGESVLITEHGKPSAYLVDVDTCEFLNASFAESEQYWKDGRILRKKRSRR